MKNEISLVFLLTLLFMVPALSDESASEVLLQVDDIVFENVSLAFSPQKDGLITDEQIKSYSESPKVEKLVQIALRNKVASGMVNSIGRCNEYVVKALNQAGMPAWTGADAYYAYQVKDVAHKYKYLDLLDSRPQMTSKDAPKGAILVYSSNSNVSCKTPKGIGCGHVEIKTENGYSDDSKKIYFVSDYSDYRPVDTDQRYKLIAILIYIKN